MAVEVTIVAMFALLVVWPFLLTALVRRMFGDRAGGVGLCETCGAREWQCRCEKG